MTDTSLGGLDPELVRAHPARSRRRRGRADPRRLPHPARGREQVADRLRSGDRRRQATPRSPSAPCSATRFPDHGIIGEEWDAKASAGAFDWIVDPIDGTRAFISGVPVWGTLIGLLHKGRAVAGLMAQPFTGEIYLGLPGTAFYRRGGETRAAPHLRRHRAQAAPR